MIEEIKVEAGDNSIIYTNAVRYSTKEERLQYMDEQRSATSHFKGHWRRFLGAMDDSFCGLYRCDVSPEPIVMPIGISGAILEKIE